MNTSVYNHINLVLVLTLFLATTNAQNLVNDDCTLANGRLGKCANIANCPGAIKIIQNKEKPVHCGFAGTQPIVCCELPKKPVGEISKQKCLEYTLKPVRLFSSPRSQGAIIPDLARGEAIHVAGKRELPLKLSLASKLHEVQSAVGGVDAIPLQFPHMAALGYGEDDDISWLCGGTVISEKYVLTAAHCINPLSRGAVKHVRLGDLNLKLTSDNAKPQNFKVARTIVHPDYKAPSVYNDIALIELSSAAILDNYVQPACLQTETNIIDSQWSATGWGVTSFLGNPADHLQNVALRPFTFEQCQAAYASTSTRKLRNGIDFKTQICAGERNKDTCQGDSGGPLQVRTYDLSGERNIVIGVTSFGKACGIGESPAVYTRVSHYIEWIESIVWP